MPPFALGFQRVVLNGPTTPPPEFNKFIASEHDDTFPSIIQPPPGFDSSEYPKASNVSVLGFLGAEQVFWNLSRRILFFGEHDVDFIRIIAHGHNRNL
jgi:hypothetical protein